MIPKELVYRIYGDSLAIIMNVKTKRVVLLQKEPLHFWKMITNKVDYSEPIFDRLVGLGILDKPSAPTLTTGQHAQEVDFGAVNLWAFKNHIPISGHFELTGRCNLRCRHCYCVFNKKKDSLTTEKIFEILDNLKESGTFGLVLTGGELFCRKDILDILKYLSEKKFVVRINSNGTLINKTVVKEMEGFSNIYRIHISLYSSEPDVHDWITNVPGSYHKTLKALHLLKEAGIDLRINCSIMKSNFNTYKQIKYEIGDRMGIPVHYDSVIFPKDDGGTENLEEHLDDEQLNAFLRFKSDHEPQNKSPYKPKLCKAGFSFFSICEDGRLFPCLKMKRLYRNPLGNLSSDSFDDIWQGSKSIQKIRDSLNKKLRECDVCDLTI
jgi:MoaA/NifB/PqqE/SkfB family radical SAM enzyme